MEHHPRRRRQLQLLELQLPAGGRDDQGNARRARCRQAQGDRCRAAPDLPRRAPRARCRGLHWSAVGDERHLAAGRVAIRAQLRGHLPVRPRLAPLRRNLAGHQASGLPGVGATLWGRCAAVTSSQLPVPISPLAETFAKLTNPLSPPCGGRCHGVTGGVRAQRLDRPGDGEPPLPSASPPQGGRRTFALKSPQEETFEKLQHSRCSVPAPERGPAPGSLQAERT